MSISNGPCELPGGEWSGEEEEDVSAYESSEEEQEVRVLALSVLYLFYWPPFFSGPSLYRKYYRTSRYIHIEKITALTSMWGSLRFAPIIIDVRRTALILRCGAMCVHRLTAHAHRCVKLKQGSTKCMQGVLPISYFSVCSLHRWHCAKYRAYRTTGILLAKQ